MSKKTEQKIDRRVIRGETSKRKIIESATELFIEYGFRKTTITMIANHAGIGYGTAYNHFPNGKEDIFLTITENVMDQIYDIASKEYTVRSKEEAFSFIQNNIRSLIEIINEHKPLATVTYEAIQLSDRVEERWKEITERLLKRIAQNVEQAIEKDLVRNPKFDPDVVASVLFYVTENYLWKIALDETDKDPETIIENIAEIYANGLYK